MTPSSHDSRLAELRAWLAAFAPVHGLALDTIRPASDDASFRRYFRIDASRAGASSLVAMAGLAAGAIAWAAVPISIAWVANAWWLGRRQEQRAIAPGIEAGVEA